MNSKIIQIAICSESQKTWPIIFALCEDGSLWRKSAIEEHAKWYKEDMTSEEAHEKEK